MTRQEDIVRESVAEAKDSTRLGRRLVLLLGILTILLLLVAGTTGYLVYDQTREQAQSGTNLAIAVQDACEDPAQRPVLPSSLCPSADQVVEKGEDIGIPVPGPQGEEGKPGPPPSQVDVLAAVALYCNEGLCDGRDGSSVTPQQVAQAVAAHCDINGECRGRPGALGSDGSDGADGADGEAGPPPTPEQIAAAVEGFCGESNCDGPQGPQGPAGTDGANGADGVDAVPFSFMFTVPGENPVEPDYRYTIRCTEANTESCEVTREEVQE